MRPSRQVLIIDDERNFREFLGEALETEGYHVTLAASARAGLDLAQRTEPRIVLLDQNLPDIPGLEILPLLLRSAARPAVIMITAYAEYSRAVAAVKSGAHHYLSKPFDFADLLEVLKELEDAGNGPSTLGMDNRHALLIGGSDPMRELARQVDQIARSAITTVLIQGESGTGKELIARAIHSLSERSDHRLLSVNCAALAETLLMSELFGHERGAFTDAREQKKGLFETAHGGTLFLDEIGEMTPKAQAALLRVLEQRVITRVGGSAEIPVDVRVVAATNRPLEQEVEAGRFRTDLYYRLNVVEIVVPPLRDRPDDILPLCRHYARFFARRYGCPVREIAPAAADRLVAYSWPGNVRELRNAIERSYVIGSGPAIEIEDLPKALLQRTIEAVDVPDTSDAGLSFRDAKQRVIHHFEREYLTRALDRADGNVSRAARDLEMPRQVLQRLLRKYGLSGADFRP